MTGQVLYEDVAIGDELPSLVKRPAKRQLVKWAGASGDYYEIHYDKDFAQANGLPGVIVHGWLTCSFLAQVATDWMGERGNIVKLSCSYRGVLFPDEDIVCKGTVTKKYGNDDGNYVEVRLWAENSGGEKTARGTAVVSLPSKE